MLSFFSNNPVPLVRICGLAFSTAVVLIVLLSSPIDEASDFILVSFFYQTGLQITTAGIAVVIYQSRANPTALSALTFYRYSAINGLIFLSLALIPIPGLGNSILTYLFSDRPLAGCVALAALAGASFMSLKSSLRRGNLTDLQIETSISLARPLVLLIVFCILRSVGFGTAVEQYVMATLLSIVAALLMLSRKRQESLVAVAAKHTYSYLHVLRLTSLPATQALARNYFGRVVVLLIGAYATSSEVLAIGTVYQANAYLQQTQAGVCQQFGYRITDASKAGAPVIGLIGSLLDSLRTLGGIALFTIPFAVFAYLEWKTGDVELSVWAAILSAVVCAGSMFSGSLYIALLTGLRKWNAALIGATVAGVILVAGRLLPFEYIESLALVEFGLLAAIYTPSYLAVRRVPRDV